MLLRKNILLPLCMLTMLGACTTYDAYTGEEKVSATAKGAGIGAGIAAVIAYIDNKDKGSSERRERILKSAVGGAAIGGGIGYYMDAQEAKLRKQLRSTGVRIERNGNNINLIMPGNILFATDSANINADFYDVLDSVAVVLVEYNRTIVAVAGHTDNTGTDQYNLGLSRDRARSVASYLRTRKIVPDRLETIGFGEAHPIASNQTPDGRQLNRRVEISLLPIEG